MLALILSIYSAIVVTFLLYFRLHIYYVRWQAKKQIEMDKHLRYVPDEGTDEGKTEVVTPYILADRLADESEPESVEEREWRLERDYLDGRVQRTNS